MTAKAIRVAGGPIFDGEQLHHGMVARFEDGRFAGLEPEDVQSGPADIDLAGDILAPGCVDLQVNGGGGVLLNDDPSVETVRRIAAAHRGLGTTHLLPTLITDRFEITETAIDAVADAIDQHVPGIAGLHLEGPHLSVARKGAHDAKLIRPMEARDLELILAAAARLPALMVTIAPEAVSTDQVRSLSEAGVLVSLGHTDARFETCLDYVTAGARCVTHLFNAMSQLGNRAPGVVGAALASGGLSAGLIADGIHVHPAVMRAAWAAKTGPGTLFLVSDAMAVAGTDLNAFQLNGRTILRKDGRLTLEDGTLAGADLDLITAIRVLVQDVGLSLSAALAAAISSPAAFVGLDDHTMRRPGLAIDQTIRITKDLSGAHPMHALVQNAGANARS